MPDNEEGDDKQESPAPAKAQMGSTKDLVKLIAGALFLLGSVGLMVHRMPHRQFVAAHEDKPRPPRPAVDTDSSDAPASPRSPVKPAAVAAKPGAPVKPGAAGKTSEPEITLVAPEKAPALDLADACSAEAPLLCYKVSEERLARCLRGYEDYLRKSCLEALPGATASRR